MDDTTMSDTKTTTKKFSEFGMVMNGPIDVVGLKDGQNVRATLTTDLVETNPGEAFRDAKGRFRSTADYEELTNQLKVNRFIANELDLINGALASLQAGSVVVQDDPPNIEADGQLWLDSNRLELFISYEDAWISTTPLAARIEQGEELQAQILARVEAGEAVQSSITEALDDGMREQTRMRSRIGDLEANSATKSDLDTKLSKSGEQILETGEWRIKQPRSGGGNASFVVINDNVMHLYHVAYPQNGEHAANAQYVDDKVAAIPEPDLSGYATEQYVDDQIAGIDIPDAPEPVAFERPVLWRYNPDVMADQLGNGEFNLSADPENGSASDWSIYFAKRDANGHYWYPHDSGNEWTHEIDAQLATIRGRDQNCVHGKTNKWYFNQGTSNYARLRLAYYRSSNPLASGKWYALHIPGYMPYFTFSADAQNNGTHS